MFPSYRKQSVDCSANQLTGFYMMGTLVVRRLKPNVVPLVFTSIKKKSPRNQLKRRSPIKRHLIAEFVKPRQKKLTPEIIELDISLDNSSYCL